MKSIAVLMTVHNRLAETLKCLKALFRQDLGLDFGIDVYLVDDGSIDGTSDTVIKLYPGIHIIHSDGCLFWNRGMYLAWDTALKTKRYDYYFWLNNDTYLYDYSLSAMLEASALFRDEAIIVGTTIDSRSPTQISYGGYREKKVISPSGKCESCDNFNGNIVLIPEFVYGKIGKNDPIFHHTLGDYDYGRRANAAHVKCVVAPAVMGLCDSHDVLPAWCNPTVTFIQRWRELRTPLGVNPEEFFMYDRRHFGILKACLHYFTIHMRMCFPAVYIWVSSLHFRTS